MAERDVCQTRANRISYQCSDLMSDLLLLKKRTNALEDLRDGQRFLCCRLGRYAQTTLEEACSGSDMVKCTCELDQRVSCMLECVSFKSECWTERGNGDANARNDAGDTADGSTVNEDVLSASCQPQDESGFAVAGKLYSNKRILAMPNDIEGDLLPSPANTCGILSLPNELLERVVDVIWQDVLAPAMWTRRDGYAPAIHDRRTLANLSLTCHRFRPLCQRFLLSSLAYHVPETGDGFLKTFGGSTILATALEELVFTDGEGRYNTAMPRLTALAHTCTNLRSVTIDCHSEYAGRENMAHFIEDVPFQELILLNYCHSCVGLIPSRPLQHLLVEFAGNPLAIADKPATGKPDVHCVTFRQLYALAIMPATQTSLISLLEALGQPKELVFDQCRLSHAVLSAMLASPFTQSVEVLSLDMIRLDRLPGRSISLANLGQLQELRTGCISWIVLTDLSKSCKWIRVLWLNARLAPLREIAKHAETAGLRFTFHHALCPVFAELRGAALFPHQEGPGRLTEYAASEGVVALEQLRAARAAAAVPVQCIDAKLWLSEPYTYHPTCGERETCAACAQRSEVESRLWDEDYQRKRQERLSQLSPLVRLIHAISFVHLS